MSYVHIKFQKSFEHISEQILSEQVSYWFFVNLLYQPPTKDNQENSGIKTLNPIFENDTELKEWFLDFFNETIDYYHQRYRILKNSKVSKW